LGIRPDYDAGILHLELQVLERSFAIAPAAVIASVAGSTLTLRTTGPEVASAAPARMFGTTWLLRIREADYYRQVAMDPASLFLSA
jgi:hypothetical protein